MGRVIYTLNPNPGACMQEPYKEPPPDADSGEDTESEVGWEDDEDDESGSGSSSSSTDDSRWGLDPSSGSSSRVRVYCTRILPSFVLPKNL